MMNEAVSTIMITDLITVHPDDSVSTARDILSTKRVHHIPVVVESKLVGILTSYDFFNLDSKSLNFDETKVGEVMTKKVATLEPNEKIGTAAEVFLVNCFHALPIVKDEVLLGLVTTFDVLKYNFKKAYPDPWQQMTIKNTKKIGTV